MYGQQYLILQIQLINMIQITLKAKHYYYIVRFLKNYSLEQYFGLFSRIKIALDGNTNDESEFTVSATVGEIVQIYKILTILPEGQSNVINTDMASMLQTQIENGVAGEIMGGNVTTDWQQLAEALINIKNENAASRDADINTGKQLINGI